MAKQNSDAGHEGGAPDPTTMTVQEVRELVSEGELTFEELEKLKESEIEAQGRKTAIQAIETALQQNAVDELDPTVINQPSSLDGEASGTVPSSDEAPPTDAAGNIDKNEMPGEAAVVLPEIGEGSVGLELAQEHLARGDHARAALLLKQARALYEQIGDSGGTARSAEEMAIVALLQGEHSEAHAHYEEALALYQQAGDRSAQADVLRQIGLLYKMRGDMIQMQRSYRAAQSLALPDGADSALE